MQLRSLYLHNFRIYEEALFEFSPSVNVICGPNASGKSTILEAIHFLAFGRSFRTNLTKDMIRKGDKFFYVEASFVKHGIEQKLRVSSDGKERKIIYNSTPCPSAASLLGLLQASPSRLMMLPLLKARLLAGAIFSICKLPSQIHYMCTT